MSTLADTRYDTLIANAMRRFVPVWDWRRLKAQLFQESMLDPSAVSPAGAQGIAQFMPPTWADMLLNVPDLPYHASPFDPEAAILAAAWYMAKLRSLWRTDRPEEDRWRLSLASYNCGFGNMTKAQQYAGGAREYALVIAHLHEVTGEKNAAETRTYVERIERYYAELAYADGADFGNVVAGVDSTAPEGAP